MARMAALEALSQAVLPRKPVRPARWPARWNDLGASSGATLNFPDFYFATRKGLEADAAPLTRSLISNPAPALARSLGISPTPGSP